VDVDLVVDFDGDGNGDVAAERRRTGGQVHVAVAVKVHDQVHVQVHDR
jgi:hypothetical protein